MATIIEKFQERVLRALAGILPAGRMGDFYLVGGTALALYYFHHRESLDLDFFTQDFKRKKVSEIIEFLSSKLKRKIELVSEQARRDRIRVMVYLMPVAKNKSLKIDFVEDHIDLMKPPKLINGIKVASLEDIYMRKIYAAMGTSHREDEVGRKVAIGGRETAKDFYDLYCFSTVFMRLSDFSFKCGNPLMREAIVRWFRTYSRFDIKTGLLDLRLRKKADYCDMERHFKKEVDRILERSIDIL